MAVDRFAVRNTKQCLVSTKSRHMENLILFINTAEKMKLYFNGLAVVPSLSDVTRNR